MKSVIVGAGTYGEVYLSYLSEAGIDIIGFLDDNQNLHGQIIRGIPVLGGVNLLTEIRDLYQVEAVYCPIGNNQLRSQILGRARMLGLKTPSFIHPKANVSSTVKMGVGVYILPNTTVMPFVNIEDDVMISIGANIAHHSKLCQGVFISNGVNLGASLVAEKFAYVGMGATVMTGVKKLGTNCLIGAGAVVIRDVKDNAVMAGVPAKILRTKE